MNRRSTILLLALASQLAVVRLAAASKVTVRFESEPPGAVLIQAGQPMGKMPRKLFYEVPANWVACITFTLPIHARWQNGVETSPQTITVCPENGHDQRFRFVSPASAARAVTDAASFDQAGKPFMYIAPSDDGFHVYLAAAVVKKGVPVTVTEVAGRAFFTLKAAQVEIQPESTGSKVLKCLVAYCIDIEDKATTSVQIVDRNGIVKWSYAVNKGRGAKNRQSMAEAIAKHLNDDCFSVYRRGQRVDSCGLAEVGP